MASRPEPPVSVFFLLSVQEGSPSGVRPRLGPGDQRPCTVGLVSPGNRKRRGDLLRPNSARGVEASAVLLRPSPEREVCPDKGN